MKSDTIPAWRAAMALRAVFPVKHGPASPVREPILSGLAMPSQLYADGTRIGWLDCTGGKVRAFAQWLCPAVDSLGEPRRAQWCSHNHETGELEATIYPEFVPDVLAKLQRLRVRSLSFHTVNC